ncbi:hypothetical protein PFTANZ_01514 [Plasmodium falciparum Tanzania (2000708)]|uniref:Uncharacterized protein n=1 Tax=Plasmodium falciparum Tanzania (2000708) TaxID=1036725 RepID=A0A024WBY1_PLAFA|nr:hypothetical protein PFTANZ_01514 [Plasmodium falciparum Tanzania (2000708)]
MWNVFNFNNIDDKLKNFKNEKEIYTHEDLRYYFEKLVKINLNNVNVNNFIELIRKITQITIWGDKYDDQIFQYVIRIKKKFISLKCCVVKFVIHI